MKQKFKLIKKSGLGKGLDALFEENQKDKDTLFEENQKEEKEVFFLDLNNIEANKNQPRKNFDEENLKNLAESIKENGIIQPILVRKISEEKYQIIAGERRFRAAKMANSKQIPVFVKDVEGKTVTEIALVENLQRENLNPIEEAKGFLELIEKYGLTQDEVAKKVGKSRSAVTNTIRLLNLPIEIVKQIENKNLTSGQARALLAFKDETELKKVALKAVEQKLSVRTIERMANLKKQEQKKEKQKKEKFSLFEELEKTMQNHLKRRVKIEIKSGEKGSLTIDFYNRDELILIKNKILN